MSNNRLTTEEFIKRAISIHGDTYDYSLVEYVKLSSKVKIICKKHGVFEQRPGNHLSNKRECPKCTKERGSSRRQTQEGYLKKAREVHGDKYDYSKVKYERSTAKITIICPEHGEFEQEACSHTVGHGCPKCAIIKTTEKQTKKGSNFIEEAKIIHNDFYDYSKTEYKKSTENVTIICPIHGEFHQTPKNHLKRRGCSECGKEKRAEKRTSNTQEFIQKSIETHGDKYSYDKVKYIRAHLKVEIICENHGSFYQVPTNHIQGAGCIRCSNTGVSDLEEEVFNFVNEIEYSKQSDRTILKGRELDIYVPSKKLAIEYNGLYWHSDLYKESNYHLKKTIDCRDKGIQLIHIFEDEWVNKKEIVKSRLKNLLGGSTRIYARKCILKEVSTKDKTKFLEENHIQGAVGSNINLGLYFNGELVSIMTFGKLRKNLGQSHKDGSWELLRFCNKLNTSVVGGAGKLLKYFETNYSPKNIISYADLRWSQGNLYEQLKFNKESETVPNYFYTTSSNSMIRESRFKYRKDILVSEGFDKNKSEREIMKERGYIRVYDCGSIKYSKKFN